MTTIRIDRVVSLAEKETRVMLHHRMNLILLALPLIYTVISILYLRTGAPGIFFSFIIGFTGTVTVLLPIQFTNTIFIEERMKRTIEPILSSPITSSEIIFGKTLPMVALSTLTGLASLLPQLLLMGGMLSPLAVCAIVTALIFASFIGSCLGILLSIKFQSLQAVSLPTFVLFFFLWVTMSIAPSAAGGFAFVFYFSPTYYLRQVILSTVGPTLGLVGTAEFLLAFSVGAMIFIAGALIVLTAKVFEWEDFLTR